MVFIESDLFGEEKGRKVEVERMHAIPNEA